MAQNPLTPEQFVRRNVETFGVSEAEAYRRLGDVMLRQGMAQDALDSYKRSLTLEPGNAAVENNLGIAYWGRIRGERADNQEEAIAHFEAALTVFTREKDAREWAQLQNNLGIVLSRREELDAARVLHEEKREAANARLSRRAFGRFFRRRSGWLLRFGCCRRNLAEVLHDFVSRDLEIKILFS